VIRLPNTVMRVSSQGSCAATQVALDAVATSQGGGTCSPSPSPEEPALSVAEGRGGHGVRTTGVGPARVAGIGIGVFLLALARTRREAGMWPLMTDRIACVAFFGIAAAVGRRSLRMPVTLATLAIGGGALDMSANGLYLLAVRIGPLSPVVTLSSLYPASTALLARAILGERLSPWQTAGVVTALLAVVLIVSG